METNDRGPRPTDKFRRVEEYAGLVTLHGQTERQRQLPFAKAVEIAWNSIRVRLFRSLLVTSGIILALAFLSYILSSDVLLRHLARNGSPGLLETLKKQGLLENLSNRDARIETWWMVGIALLVSFVGILNAMLLSVTERFSEIGTMKCLGALDSLIVELFLLESAFQGLLGTLLGIGIGLGLALAEGASLYGSDMWAYLPGGGLLRTALLCTAVGVGLTIAGALYPALKAAQMEPVEAMRTEA